MDDVVLVVDVRVGWRDIACLWWEVRLPVAIEFTDLPGLALLVHKYGQRFCVFVACFSETRIAAEFAGKVVLGFTVACHPDLTWREVEVEQVVDGLRRQETVNLVGDDLAAYIDHLDVGYLVLLFVIAKRNIGLLVDGDALPEVRKRRLWVFVFVVGTRELETNVALQ